MRFQQRYREQIYAGVLGKMIGVYLGRPVEGWPYQSIIDRFGEIPYYVNEQLGLPLIVADDDLSGTFAFFRAMEDSGYDPNLTAKQVGDAWLNYIIENRTILWWGGLGNSTEHTAYLRLKSGIPAPESGSIARNGTVLPQQIGGQIFMDAYAMMCPGDPERAAHFVREAASVSHDGVGVDGAVFLGALEAAAFDEKDLGQLLDSCERFITTDELRRAVCDTREICAKHTDWRAVRDWLDAHYGYGLYQGPCHMIPNHTMVLASLLMGGDDFAKSVKIAASAAWDTDCNAGNVGCLNGIRLGLDAIDAGPDFRTPMADRTYVVTSDGGEGISDAVRETRKILSAALSLAGLPDDQPKERFAFEQRGSVQGFMPCPYFDHQPAGVFALSNANQSGEGNGLKLQFSTLAEGVPAQISVATFLEIREEYRNYETYASPTLYSGQTVSAQLDCEAEGICAAPYIWYADAYGKLQLAAGGPLPLKAGENQITWQIPDTGGMPVCRFGFRFTSVKRFTNAVIIRSVDWANTPERFVQEGILMKDMWDLSPFWAKAFVPSAQSFAPNLNHTYCISHPEDNGLATIGTCDFTDYRITSTISISLHKACGLVARAKGHRRYYAVILSGRNTLSIVKRLDGTETVLASTGFPYREFTPYALSFSVCGNRLEAAVDGKALLSCEDVNCPYTCGGAGFVIHSGAAYIDGFTLEKSDQRSIP